MKRFTFDRRQLVTAGMSGALAALAPWERSALAGDASGVEPHFFVFAQIYGAWDVCLAFDPQDRDARMPDGSPQFDQPYAMNEVKDYGGVRLAPGGFGLAPFADRLAVINGIEMEVDNGHICDTVMTGVINARTLNAPYVQAILAKRHPYLKGMCLPHIYASYDGSFFSGPFSAASVTSTAADALKLLGADGGSSFAAVHALADGYLGRLASAADRRLVGLYLDATSRASDFSARVNDGTFAAPDDPTTAAGFATVIGQLFQRQLLGSATWSLPTVFGGPTRIGFDTHSDHYAQHPLPAALDGVGTLCATLAAMPFDEHRSVLDMTTVVLTAEFARTARLNGAQGKDHNIHTNSVVLIGKGVRAGAYGASGLRVEANGAIEPHAALPVDLATGRPSASGTILKAKNVWAGLGGVFGADLAADLGAGIAPIKFLG